MGLAAALLTLIHQAFKPLRHNKTVFLKLFLKPYLHGP
jgi:hypothetical protein